jgi:hypothetical protein
MSFTVQGFDDETADSRWSFGRKLGWRRLISHCARVTARQKKLSTSFNVTFASSKQLMPGLESQKHNAWIRRSTNLMNCTAGNRGPCKSERPCWAAPSARPSGRPWLPLRSRSREPQQSPASSFADAGRAVMMELEDEVTWNRRRTQA